MGKLQWKLVKSRAEGHYPHRFRGMRGYLWKPTIITITSKAGIDMEFVQDNQSASKGVPAACISRLTIPRTSWCAWWPARFMDVAVD